METLKKSLEDLRFHRKIMFLFLDRPKKYFSEELEIFSNIKVEAKFDCGSNARTLRLWKALSEAPDEKFLLFPEKSTKSIVNFADLLCSKPRYFGDLEKKHTAQFKNYIPFLFFEIISSSLDMFELYVWKCEIWGLFENCDFWNRF